MVKNPPPTDKKLLELLEKAYERKFLCHVARIKFEGIIPFSAEHIPTVTQNFVDYFSDKLNEGGVPLYVYQKGDKFIMSDDYSAYYIYKSVNIDYVACIVLGDPKGQFVISKSEPFKLEMEPVFVG